jgi:hypothetical protein
MKTASPFPISTPRQLLAKSKREIERLERETSGMRGAADYTAIADLTLDAACTLWHVTDWIANSRDPKLLAIVASKGCTTPERAERVQAFQRQLRTESHDLRICWALALRFKHFELEDDSKAREVFDDQDVTVSGLPGYGHVDVSLRQVETIKMPVFSGVTAPVSMSVVGQVSVSNLTTSTVHPKVTYRKQRLRLVDVYRRSYAFLDALLKKHGL